MMESEKSRVVAQTFLAEAQETLDRLAAGLDIPAEKSASMRARTATVFGPWGDREITSVARHPSALSDDSSPYEWSIVLEPDRRELRLLFEKPPEGPDFAARLASSLEMHQQIVDELGAATERFDAVADLFSPADGSGAFAVWHAIRLWPTEEPLEIKAYFNPQVRGHRNAPALVEEAMQRLGFGSAWSHVAAAMPRGPDMDEIRYFALDLWNGDAARVKVYIYHREPTRDVLLRAAATCPTADTERLAQFFTDVTRGRSPKLGFCPGTCLSFCTGSGQHPVAATLHVPIRAYVHDDEDAAARVSELVGASRAAIYRSALDAVRRRPLHAGVGLTTYLSMRSSAAGERITAYLASESYATMAPGSMRAMPQPVEPAPPVVRLVEECEAQPIRLHPFLQHMSRHPVDVQHMWLLFENIYLGLSRHFTRWLAHLIARTEDERIRSLLAAQLHEELGSGDPARTHRLLLLQLLEKLSPWQPAHVTEDMRQPGLRWGERLEQIYMEPNPHVGIGAAIVIELLGKQFDLFVADQFRRQQAVGLASLEWLTLHETLELEHADESRQIAEWISDDHAREAAWRGGRAVFVAGWKFLDDMYDRCFA